MLRRMRTTIRINEQLLAWARQQAAASGKTLAAVIEEALREYLACRASLPRRKPVRLRTVKGSGSLPRIDIDDSAALLQSMDG